MTDPTVADVADVVAACLTDLTSGMTAACAAQNLARDGANELRSVPPVPPWRRALAQLHDPLIYLSMVAASVALTGQLLRIPSAALVLGDVLVLAEGDAVGADARLAETADLLLLEASLTGESEPVLKDAATLKSPAALGDRLNMVFKGTSVAQGSGRAVVTAVGMQSEVGTIATLLDATVDQPTPLQVEVARIGRVLGLAAVVIALVVVATILLIDHVRVPADIVRVLLLGVSLAVATVPEGLPAILSVVLALGV
jgi:magnesium-transporting ATPase (P-type)